MVPTDERIYRVFISYSHEPDGHELLVLDLCDQLRADGVDAHCDQYETSPPDGWILWMEQELAAADFVLIVCTEQYGKRLSGKEHPGLGHGAIWEERLIYQCIYNNSTVGSKFVPVLLPGSEISHIPSPLQSATYYRLAPPFVLESDGGYQALYRRITGQHFVLVPGIGKKRSLVPMPKRTQIDPQSSAAVAISLGAPPDTPPKHPPESHSDHREPLEGPLSVRLEITLPL